MCGQLVGSHRECLGATLSDVGEVGGLVRFATMRLRGEIGAIGLQHQSLDALGAQGFADVGGIFVSDHSSEGGASTALDYMNTGTIIDLCGNVNLHNKI